MNWILHMLLITIILILSSVSVNTLTYENVSHLPWTIRNTNQSIEVPCNLPEGVYTTLQKTGILESGDLYYRYNDLNYRWVSYENWTFQTELAASQKVMSEHRVVLEFEGLDTAAHIVIGNQETGFTDNMFSRTIIDVKDIFVDSSSQPLQILFESPVRYAEKVFTKWLEKDGYPILPSCVVNQFKGECHANIIRKMQASFSWDWGPAIPDSGIWKTWNLVGWSTFKIHDVLFEATTSHELPPTPDVNVRPEWNVTVQVWLDSAMTTGTIQGEITIELGGITYVKESEDFDLDNIEIDEDYQAVLYETTFVVPKDTVELWWPNGYGAQTLYNLTVTWQSITGERSTKTVRVGFRTVELDQTLINEKIPENGRNFFFRINNVEIFMKGSNWIPAHVITDRVSSQYTRQLLQDAADTHQNCMRVWGGGIYETDLFYEIADELGIFIWQDMMFACSMYAGNPDFLNSVRKELKTQVRRLQQHPSILIWAANNENELALRDNWYGTSENFEQYKQDYIKLYVDIVRNVTTSIDGSRDFLVSSPSNGIESEMEGYIAKNPGDVRFGDVHHYDYYSNGWNWENFQKARFTSEYGFQSWPSFRTLRNALDPEDFKINSPMMEHRQHHPLGQIELAIQLGVHMKFNESSTSFEHYLYMTQINQAMSMKTETEHLRRMRNTLDADDKGNSMGALYWQLNDIWQGASWASIEYGGRWKMLHYYVKNFLSPLLISPWISDRTTLKVNLVSDLTTDLHSLTLRVRLYGYKSFSPLMTKSMAVEAKHLRSETVVSLNLEHDLKISSLCDSEFPKDNCFVVVSLVHDFATIDAPSNFLFLGEPKDAPLEEAHIKVVTVTEESENKFYIVLNSDHVALFVWLETDVSGVFSDNGFILYEPNVGVVFNARENTTAKFLRDSLQITSLTDTY